MYIESFIEDALTVHSFISIETSFYFELINNPSKEEQAAFRKILELIDQLDMLLEPSVTPRANAENYSVLYRTLFQCLDTLAIAEIMKQGIVDKLRTLNHREHIEFFTLFESEIPFQKFSARQWDPAIMPT